MASKLPSSCNVQYNSDNSQQTLETHIPSVRKKSGKDFELGKTLGEGSYSMTASLNTDFEVIFCVFGYMSVNGSRDFKRGKCRDLQSLMSVNGSRDFKRDNRQM
ncbi:unnamed protein product [Rhizophagus irregularis]|nr:unnamed protein product [Rhizophagus irregularis]